MGKEIRERGGMDTKEACWNLFLQKVRLPPEHSFMLSEREGTQKWWPKLSLGIYTFVGSQEFENHLMLLSGRKQFESSMPQVSGPA
jgi:hypothetical protein